MCPLFFGLNDMKNKIYILSGFVFVFFLVLAFLMIREKSVTNLDEAFLKKPVPQDLKDRIWKEIVFEKHGESDDFISSSHIRFRDSLIYVVDNDNHVIKQYDRNGKFIQNFGKGNGRGPGEFLTIIDIQVTENNELWALDDKNIRATIFDLKNNQEWTSINFSTAFNKIIPIEKNKYWFQSRYDNQMDIYTISGDKIGQIEKFVDDPQLWAFVLESFYALAGNNLVLAQYHTNYISKISNNGQILYFREPIAFLGLPKIDPHYANDVARINTVDFTSWKQISSDPHVNSKSIHIYVKLKNSKTEEWDNSFIDVYNLTDGDYLYSYELPEKLEALTVTDDLLIGVSEETGKLKIWRSLE